MHVLPLAFFAISAAADLRRVRLRSGEYPAAISSQDVDETLARVGGLGGSPMPAGCHAWLHRPDDLQNDSAFHPMKLASTVLILAGPVGLVGFEQVLDRTGSRSGEWLVPSANGRYVPDHRRYSRGGSLWAFNWQLRGESTEELADGEQTTWLGRALSLVAATRATAEGRLNPVTALSAAAPWCLDSSSWLEILLRGWQGVFIALSLLAEQVCHSSAGGCEHAWESDPEDRGSSHATFPCAARSALAVLRQVPSPEAPAPVLSLLAELLRGCSLSEASDAASLSAFWWKLAFWRPTSSGCEEAAATMLLAPIRRRTIGLRLCRATSSVQHDVEIHILGVSASVGEAKDKECVLIEVVMHITSKDGCYVTQAGSNPRTVPKSFLLAWTAALEGDTGSALAECSAASAFGTDVVLRCAISSQELQSCGEIQTMQLSAGAWRVGGIRLCGAGKTLALLDVMPDPPPHRLTVCSGVMFNAGQRIPEFPGGSPLLRQWLDFHEELGVDHFVLYDSDGSAAPEVEGRQGKVTYFPEWPSRLSAKLGEISLTSHCRHCLSVLAEAHCLFRSRGLSSWVITLHSFDAYLAPAPSWGASGALGRILHQLDKNRHQIGTVPLAMVEFGGTPQNSSLLVERFQLRAPQPMLVLAQIGRGNPRDESWLNHPGVTLRNPENVWGVLDHYARSVPGATDVEMPHELLRVNHYVDIFGQRCSSRFWHCTFPDAGLLWVLPTLKARYQL
ncbi:hypothetical protein AK812_SmicGene11011 [Symbiodinium microadriaticum]|uniref:Uncharacterized protein n=1 Tax=Symbiodinium microadriaticum TaxID=2951 RepID=A0A1Q9EEA6_SYMMI|nr:hypothetical protein AK812_SmicGene11011 [Symbiodinium microadriaticum]